MDLRQYRYFLAVADELHFGRAAKRLRISQPSLSLQIQRLERDLGTALLKRTKRRVELTPSGAVLAERARSVLDAAARAEAEVKRIGRGDRDRLTLGYMSSAMLPMFPPALRRFHAERPEVDVEVLDRQVVSLAQRGHGLFEAHEAHAERFGLLLGQVAVIHSSKRLPLH